MMKKVESMSTLSQAYETLKEEKENFDTKISDLMNQLANSRDQTMMLEKQVGCHIEMQANQKSEIQTLTLNNERLVGKLNDLTEKYEDVEPEQLQKSQQLNKKLMSEMESLKRALN